MAASSFEIAYQEAHINDDKRPNVIAAMAVVLAFAYVAVALRFLSRHVAPTRYGVDDWLITLGLLFTSAYVGSLYSTVHYGLGRHAILITNVKGFAQSSIAAETMYNVSIAVIKLSILFLYGRIFVQPWFKKALIALGAFVIAYSIAQIFGDIFQCVPIKSLWDPSVSGYCINYPDLIIIMGVINIVTEIIMLVLPLPLLWRLQLSRSRKSLLTVLFTMGGFVCIVSIVRLFYAHQVNSPDPSWDYVNPSTISGIECCIGIISACLPTYRPLYSYVHHGYGATEARSKASQSGDGSLALRLMKASVQSGSSRQTEEGGSPSYTQLGTETDISGKDHPAGNYSKPRGGEITITKTFSATAMR